MVFTKEVSIEQKRNYNNLKTFLYPFSPVKDQVSLK